MNTRTWSVTVVVLTGSLMLLSRFFGRQPLMSLVIWRPSNMFNVSCNQVARGCSHLLEDPFSEGSALNLEHEPGGDGCSPVCPCHDMIANSQAAHNLQDHDGLATCYKLPAARPRKTT
jgi:hypothetical protein